MSYIGSDGMKKVKLMSNNNEKSKQIENMIKENKNINNFKIVEENPDIAIAIGGDGSFLRMVKGENFREDLLYVGINAGTLGFAQEFNIEEIDELLEVLKEDRFKVNSVAVQETKVICKTKTEYYNSLNEIVIRDGALNTLNMDILIDHTLLESFVGDGILVATSFGSTAYNLSFGGSIVDSTFHTLQITPIAPLNNKSYRNLLNSVILPTHKKIILIPKKEQIILTIDGENHFYQDIERIETTIEDKKILCLKRENSNFSKKINEKLLK